MTNTEQIVDFWKIGSCLYGILIIFQGEERVMCLMYTCICSRICVLKLKYISHQRLCHICMTKFNFVCIGEFCVEDSV